MSSAHFPYEILTPSRKISLKQSSPALQLNIPLAHFASEITPDVSQASLSRGQLMCRKHLSVFRLHWSQLFMFCFIYVTEDIQ